MADYSPDDLAELAGIKARREEREALGLSAQEVAAAKAFGMTAEAYAAAKQVRNVTDWLARHGQPQEER